MLVGSGVLGPGESEYFDVNLTAGYEYRVYVHPENSLADFDLHIYDQSGNLVSYDESTESDAHGLMRPAWTGPFRILVNSSGGASRYTVAVYQ